MEYDNLKDRAEEICLNEKNFIANASSLSSLIIRCLKDINWVGFYLLSGEELVLGPFQGKPACIRIPIGKGVCGTAAKNKQPIIVHNVDTFPGHIVCDPESRSEMVVPLVFEDNLLGVLDIDSNSKNRFNERDLKQIEEVANILLNSSDIDALNKYYRFSQ
jgi:GAF domain-containing protein